MPAGISHLCICTRFPSYLNCSQLSKGKTITREAKSIHCIQCCALWSLAEILKLCAFTRSKALVTHSLTHCNLQYLLDWCDFGLWLKMPAQNFLMLLMLLMLMLRNVLTTVWSRFWSWGLVEILYLVFITILKLKFDQDFEVCFRSRLWGWDLIKILKLKFGQDFEPEVWSRFGSWSFIEIRKLNFDQLVT